MQIHGRKLVGVNKVASCQGCQKHATVCDIQDPAFALCEDCFEAWDYKQEARATSVLIEYGRV